MKHPYSFGKTISLVNKKIMKSKEELEQNLSEKDKHESVRECIISGHLLPIKARMENFKTLEISIELV